MRRAFHNAQNCALFFFFFRWGKETERVDVTCNAQQSEATRDALAKGVYARLFDYLVRVRKGGREEGRG